MPRPGHHVWTEEPMRYERHSDRACFACGLIKRTRHEDGQHWVEYVDQGAIVARPGSPVPNCPGEVDHQAMEVSDRDTTGSAEPIVAQEPAPIAPVSGAGSRFP